MWWFFIIQGCRQVNKNLVIDNMGSVNARCTVIDIEKEGRVMKKLAVLFLILTVAQYLISGEIGNFEKDHIVCRVSGDITELEFSLPQYEMQEIELEGEIYNRILISGGGEFSEPSLPELPCFSTLVAVPDLGRVRLEIISSEQDIINDVLLYPRQIPQSESESGTREFIKSHSFYESGSIYPACPAQSGEPVILRDYRLVRVTYNPFQYDPAGSELRVNKAVSVRIITDSGVGINELTDIRQPSQAYDKMYRNTIINYEGFRREGEFQQPCILYIYVSNSTVEDYLQYLVDWRRQKGFEVHTASTTQTGSNSASIKNYIQSAYDTWENRPEYVCLVGDANGSYNIPCYWVDTGETDNNYVMLAGSDILPDAAIGRLPFESTTQLATIITKIINYEKEPYMGNPNWFQRGLMVGDASVSGTTCIDTKLYISDMMAQAAPNVESIGVYSGAFYSQMTSNLNQGCVYFNYRGWGDFSGFGVSAIDGLSNGWMMPVVVFLTCGTGSYAGYTDCMSERFLKAGTVSNPKGAVAAISTATNLTHTTYNNCVDAGIWSGLFVDESWNMGTALTRGKLNMYLTFPNNPANCQHQFISWNNLMGDPSMEVWSDTPSEFQVTAPFAIHPDQGEIEIIVNSAGEGIEGAWVTLIDESDNAVSAFSEASGSAWLPVGTLGEGELILTVSGHNYIPNQSSIELLLSNGYLSIDWAVSDEVSGNGNGLANPGEQIELELELSNHYGSDLNNITLIATSPIEGLEFLEDTIAIPFLEAGSTIGLGTPLSMILPEDITGIEELILDIFLEEGDDGRSLRINIPVYAPMLSMHHYNLDITGNFDPGDNADMVVYMQNVGISTAGNVTVTLASTDSRLQISENSAFYGQIPPGSMGNNISSPFHLIAQTTIIPGSQIELILNIDTPELIHPEVRFPFTVGESGTGDPLGPDGGGYYCYDQSDIGYAECPEYNWIEIDPNSGGAGTVIPLVDNGNTGDVEQVSLPINFVFYGESYSEMAVCSNGWLSPGETASRDFMNGPLPGPGGPSPMLAPFWDDLMIGSGRVCYYHDAQNHTFIVEWSGLLIDYSNSPVTFQAILYDAGYYPTSSGNSNILFQYAEFNNDDAGSYGGYYVYHGQYVTIGLEDHTGTKGLQYTYNNVYPLQAEALGDGTAIFFTSAPIPHEDAYLVLYQDEIIDDNGNGVIEYGENIEILISLNNIGEQGAGEVSISGVLEDEFVTLVTDTCLYPDIAGGVNIFPESGFELIISENVPDGHQFVLNITIHYNGLTASQNRAYMAYAPLVANNQIFILNDDNNNQIADPGEIFDLGISLVNQGGAATYSTQASLVSLDPALTIFEPYNQLNIISPGEEAYLLFPAILDDSLVPGEYVDLLLNITGDFSYSAELTYRLTIGQALEDFESGDFSRFPWVSSGAAEFVISNVAFNGSYSAQSGDIGDSQYTQLEIDIETAQPNAVSFWMKVSSEAGWDYVRFYINEELMDSWSGEIDWFQAGYDLAAGNHNFRWAYIKDVIISSGSDCFWLDDIVFPSSCGQSPEALLIDTQVLDFDLVMQQTETAELGLINIAQNLGEYEIAIEGEGDTWLSVIPDQGFIPPGQQIYVEVVCEPAGLSTGEYNTAIHITDNFGGEFEINVHLSYLANPDTEDELPNNTAYLGNYPNPFNPSTTFSFQLAEGQFVNHTIYNIKGQKVRTLVAEYLQPGFYNLEWNGTDEQNKRIATGIYFSHFKTPQIDIFDKILMLK